MLSGGPQTAEGMQFNRTGVTGMRGADHGAVAPAARV